MQSDDILNDQQIYLATVTIYLILFFLLFSGFETVRWALYLFFAIQLIFGISCGLLLIGDSKLEKLKSVTTIPDYTRHAMTILFSLIWVSQGHYWISILQLLSGMFNTTLLTKNYYLKKEQGLVK